MTGTDLYGGLATSSDARHALELAARIVVLQPLGVEALPEEVRAKAVAIVQSARAPRSPAPVEDLFEVCVIGHLRAVKNPWLAADAARLLPPSSRIRILQMGAALDPELASRARAEMATNQRYRWLGELPRIEALTTLGRCRLLLVTSFLEGGANVVSEALAAEVPILSTRIAGSIGLLGSDYPGYFPVGDASALALLLDRSERDPSFHSHLRAWCSRLVPLVAPLRERQSWHDLISQLTAST